MANTRWRVLAALMTMTILILADVIFIIAAYYEVPKLRSLPTNGIAIAIMAAVPVLGATITFSCWKPGPPEEDVPQEDVPPPPPEEDFPPPQPEEDVPPPPQEGDVPPPPPINSPASASP